MTTENREREKRKPVKWFPTHETRLIGRRKSLFPTLIRAREVCGKGGMTMRERLNGDAKMPFP
ncbi:hypothetical protein QVN81_02305 [Prevotella lascolaii]|uniref:Uncharacterized protein n=1 Tax=Leyella lascolaii TaxID=1776379 RepID=A0AAW7JJ40_9BACT|nr:hypothetical protein [Leyella lascolaii]MDN0021861.1 hypothetical protein [Leyella lascolaii]MDN0024358.1 hypothetical protein [Leyella lascolaii]